MIRNNHLQRIHRIQEIKYRNATYHGEIKEGNFDGCGLVYFHEEGHLIGCKNFKQSHIYGCAFFVYDKANYHFGEWNDNKPHGMSVFRIGEAVIVLQYKNGCITNASKTFILLQTQNIGVIAEVHNQGKWKILQKNEVYCIEHIERLISKCNFSCSLIEIAFFHFISHRFNQAPFKLRFIDNSHYIFGFQQRIQVFFDEKQCLMQVETKRQKNKTERLIEIQTMSPVKPGHVYKNSLITADVPNFRNKVIKDPAKIYFEQLKNVLEKGLLKAIISGFIMETSSLGKSRNIGNDTSLMFSKLQPLKMFEIVSPKQSQQKSMPFDIKLNHQTCNFQSEQSPNILTDQKLSVITQINAKFSQSKLLRQPIKLFSFQESPTKKQQSNLLNIQNQKIKQKSEPKIGQINQQKIDQTLDLRNDLEETSSPKKIKKKIFDSSSKKSLYSQHSPFKSLASQSKRNHRIFPPNYTKFESSSSSSSSSSFDCAQSDSSKVKPRPGSPILALKSQALKTQKPKEDQISKEKNNQTKPIQTKINQTEKQEKNLSQRKRALTELEYQSDVVSEDMSNLLDLNNNNTKIHDFPLKKLQKHNNIYLESEKQQKKQEKKVKKVRVNDNSPYLAQVTPKTEYSRSEATAYHRRVIQNGPYQKRFHYL